MVIRSPALSCIVPMRQVMASRSICRERTPRDTGLAGDAGDDGGVAVLAAARGEDAGCRLHALDIGRAGFDGHQDAVLAARLDAGGILGGEDDLAAGRARRHAEPVGDRAFRRHRSVETRMQQLGDAGGIDAQHGLVRRPDAALDPVDRRFEFGCRAG